MDNKRASGILLPIFSLPGKYGIGCFSKEAYKFVDFLKASGQTYWQILPLGPTGYGDSPYQSFSTFAGNPYFIDLDALIREGLLEDSDVSVLEVKDAKHSKSSAQDTQIDYGFQYNTRFKVLRKAFENFNPDTDRTFQTFVDHNSDWLPDYALFMSIKDSYGGKSYIYWDDGVRFYQPEAIAEAKKKFESDILFYEFLQYEFMIQWLDLKHYANRNGVRIIGDIPIYVSPDSSDIWTHPEMFQTDEKNVPTFIAGVPPDGFSADGQTWGNPLYNWDAMKKDGYKWWLRRIEKCCELYDVVRIDHFRGFDEYFSIKYGEKTARDGKWEKGPGIDLFKAINAKMGDVPIIAEDLGYLTDTVIKLVKDTGYPGMKIIEFAFDSRDSSGANAYLPHNYDKNCVVYTGTHDNETLAGFLSSIKKSEKKMIMEYTGITDLASSMSKAYKAAGKSEKYIEKQENKAIVDACIRLAESSTANYCIIPMQDWLGLGNEARINFPSTLGGNWMWRMTRDQESDKLAKKIKKMTCLYGRGDETADKE